MPPLLRQDPPVDMIPVPYEVYKKQWKYSKKLL